MRLPRVVCPNSQSVLRSFRRQSVAVRVESCECAAEAAHDVRGSGNELFCVIVDARKPLEEICLGEDLKRIPLAIMAPSMGKFRNLSVKLKAWAEFNLRIYLRCDDAANVSALRVLSSMGIHTCALLGTGKEDWEAINDLMTYAVLGQFHHAPIEPFFSIATSYRSDTYVEWGAIYFDDPNYFLHLDEMGRVALSRAELERGEFIAQSFAECAVMEDLPAMKQRRRAWAAYFIENHACSFCPGWKACLGRFSALLPQNKGCSDFFRDMLDVARQFKRLNTSRKDNLVWRP